ncbi:uncharacterized protein [Aquarana catesbeiana]|uniref:uncharacterized protein isoform X3 n=1 Tax=Aquarana catesbeiana TaxID=8400 RepID=UPI003CC936C9
MTERILRLTLEIIYLLTGEDDGPIKKSSDSSPYLTPERNDKKILASLTRWYKVPSSLHKIYPEKTNTCWRCGEAEGSYKVSGCHCLFLHGGVGVYRRTQGSLQGRHDGELAAPHITWYGRNGLS